MVSNILSWVELLSRGVVSDLYEEKQKNGLHLESCLYTFLKMLQRFTVVLQIMKCISLLLLFYILIKVFFSTMHQHVVGKKELSMTVFVSQILKHS